MPKRHNRRGLTLVELLVVITIIGILVALAMPVISAARNSARNSACKNNLRQMGMGLQIYAERHGAFCSGAFDWRHDGAVTEVGWVADLVSQGNLVGESLCTENPAKLAKTYHDLLMGTREGLNACQVNLEGTRPMVDQTGLTVTNACRRLIDLPPGSPARREIVGREILDEHYNTNYAASWFLVRGEMKLDDSGNLEGPSSCFPSPTQRAFTTGPLRPSILDRSTAPSSLVPFLACGNSAGGAESVLPVAVGSHTKGAPLAQPFSRGPVSTTTLNPPTFAEGTPRTGAEGWWAGWTRGTLQDYRAFGPVHGAGEQRSANLLFADGSVRAFVDADGDGVLNNGFPRSVGAVAADNDAELPKKTVYSKWSLSVN